MATKKSAVKDLTNGSPVKLILGFALPLLLGMLFQQFYSMVDTIIVGKFLGVDALASVGSTSAINFMINGFVIGVCTGFPFRLHSGSAHRITRTCAVSSLMPDGSPPVLPWS